MRGTFFVVGVLCEVQWAGYVASTFVIYYAWDVFVVAVLCTMSKPRYIYIGFLLRVGRFVVDALCAVGRSLCICIFFFTMLGPLFVVDVLCTVSRPRYNYIP